MLLSDHFYPFFVSKFFFTFHGICHFPTDLIIFTEINDLFIYLQKYEQLYINQEKRGVINEKTHFDYALCLVRSKYTNDIRKGIAFLQG